ncbi:polysaccharide pyruvyl transferase family protein [Flaviramulus sp. BrNp1-15]|uniref:polysaccharide pyruvyl transferase family protein n=1 Tax=Flaviramulus sp. BrNp1-15 TaxID=2916754 RepID=UPI001EE8C77D|nr:polysaccharide pyruvyl transferase family protein [Flaviramulus sp. BrNp1-15]ULC58270.1 polysaccharide pyruvyl transferase family protein [Flaviramulus sp. BrNp1-15]
MNIKTITCHEVYNHGASLQEHALLKHLEILGHSTEAIHYKPPYLSKHLDLWKISNVKYEKNIIVKWIYILAKLPTRLRDLKRKKAFDNFSKKHIKTGEKLYISNDELKANPPLADTYICGSDQIWNSYFQNGKDPAFYLDFVPDEKLKISYAASFAIDAIEDNLKPFVKEKISRLNHVSVRETSGLRILKELGVNNATQVLDPVFLLDKEYWKENFVTPINDKYILIYDFDSNPLIKNMALKLAKENGLKIFTVNKNIKYANSNFWLKGPEYFLSLLANAQLVISNSFHAVAFSLIFNKQFYVVNREEKINTRMRDLLALLDISNILVDESNFNNASLKPIKSYSSINKNLATSINSSKTFLSKSLN